MPDTAYLPDDVAALEAILATLKHSSEDIVPPKKRPDISFLGIRHKRRQLAPHRMLRIPMKPATDSSIKPVSHSDSFRPQFRFEAGHSSD